MTRRPTWAALAGAVIFACALAGCSPPDADDSGPSTQPPSAATATGEPGATSGSPTDGNNTQTSTGETETDRTETTMHITVGERTLTATLADNSSAEALKDLLEKGPLTIDMRDYDGMEKVGDLGQRLPTNDERISTEAGDLILYQGRNFVIYYDSNSWQLTRLGTIEGVSAQELRQILGNGDVTVTLELPS
ncbi:MAG: cyclophilin-like fold protein [Actinomycetaceae bacterium]|nr:cyclophilin-like fold protein [Actinomycetaceae bacterium]